MAEIGVSSANSINSVPFIGGLGQKQVHNNNRQSAGYFEYTKNPNANKAQDTQNTDPEVNNTNEINSSAQKPVNYAEAIKIGLKTIPVDILTKALKDAEIEVTQYTMDIVKSLISGSLPLTEKNIVGLLLNSQMFKNIPLNLLALMMRLEIPITPENAGQFKNLIGAEEKLSDKIEILISNLNNEIFTGSKNITELLDNLARIRNIISDNNQNNQNSPNIPNNNNNTVNINSRQIFNNYEINNLLNMLRGLKAPESILNQIVNINRGNVRNVEISENPVNSIIDIINKFVQDLHGRTSDMRTFQQVKNLFESSEFQKLLKFVIEDKLFINPKNLSGGQIEKFYNDLNENLSKLIDLTADKYRMNENPENMRFQYKFKSEAKSIKDCLSLMNELNKTMPFLQIPIKFSNKIVNSDLYIFKNKKRKEKSGENTSKNLNALIKLDLENLGAVDIYVNISGKNICSKFFADREKSVEEITKNLPILNNIITRMGFHFTSSASSSEKGFNFVDDFINRETPKTEVKKYLFRKKI